jgi:transglutaminase-like putative cysteine protease
MLRPMRLLSVVALLVVAGCLVTTASESSSPPSVKITNPHKQIWKVGLEITGSNGPATGIVASAPVPDSWPEQQIKVLTQEKSDNVRKVSFRKLGDGARQMTVEVPRLAAGETANAMITFEVTRSFVEGPTETADLQLVKRPDRNLRAYLAPSPMIESSHANVRTLAKKITADKSNAWQQTEAIYNWVKENVEYREGNLKGALAAMRDGTGDCEEFASLIIALCRASKIPARSVWVPDHCYCEFYLEDAKGEGLWIPCDATRDYPFGSVLEPRMILQKGDNIFVPELRKRVRYARATLKIDNLRGRTQPTIKYIRQQVD